MIAAQNKPRYQSGMGTIGDKADELEALLQERFRFKSRDLHHALRKAGRRVPRRMRVEGEYIALAKHMETNPKLAKQIDQPRAEAGHRELMAFVGAIDPRDRLIDGVLSVIGPLVFGLIVLFVASIAVLRWRGLI